VVLLNCERFCAGWKLLMIRVKSHKLEGRETFKRVLKDCMILVSSDGVSRVGRDSSRDPFFRVCL